MSDLYYERKQLSIREKCKYDPIYKAKIEKIKKDIKNKKDKR